MKGYVAIWRGVLVNTIMYAHVFGILTTKRPQQPWNAESAGCQSGVQQQAFFFYQLNTFLKHVENNPYLGLLISKDLKWANHVDKTCKKASSILGFIQHNLRHCPLQCRKSAYIALVRSTLEYGSVVWDPHLQKDTYRQARDGAAQSGPFHQAWLPLPLLLLLVPGSW